MILITGANGLAGSAVIREFARQQSPVRALVRSRAKAQALAILPAVEVVEGDISQPETLAAALDAVDRVLLISSPDQQMVEMQSAFIDTAKRGGVRHIVKFSGLNASLDSPFLFNRMHAEIERHLERSGMTWTHLRPSQFMPMYLREVPAIVAQSVLFLPLEDAKLAPVDMGDIAKAAFALLHRPAHEGKRYEMTGPEALSMSEIAEQISHAVGKTMRYVNVSPAQRSEALLTAGLPAYVVEALDVQARERRKGTTGEDVVHPETHVALGIPPTTFAEFARRNANVFLGETSPRPLPKQALNSNTN